MKYALYCPCCRRIVCLTGSIEDGAWCQPCNEDMIVIPWLAQ